MQCNTLPQGTPMPLPDTEPRMTTSSADRLALRQVPMIEFGYRKPSCRIDLIAGKILRLG